MRKLDLIKQSKLLKTEIKILSLFNQQYGLKLGKLNNRTGTDRVKKRVYLWIAREMQ